LIATEISHGRFKKKECPLDPFSLSWSTVSDQGYNDSTVRKAMFETRWQCGTFPKMIFRWEPWLVFVVLLQLHCARPVREGEQAPAFSLTGLDGNRAELAEMRGKVVALHFWATWCPPCLTELPELIRFSKTLDPNKVVLLPVCVDSARPEEIRKFLRSWGFDIPVYLDPGGGTAHRYGTYRYPETYILDTRGVVRKKIIGPGDWRSEGWAQFLQNLFEQKGDASVGVFLPKATNVFSYDFQAFLRKEGKRLFPG